MDVAVGAGADDYSDLGEDWQVVTPMEILDTVGKALDGAKIAVKSSSIEYLPKNRKTVTGREAEVCLNLVDVIDEHDDTQHVYADFDISDEELKRLSD